jgi:cellulose synthase/poly-beta-1,6-N-acetylglucosamine synthase-like glycosyltransferase
MTMSWKLEIFALALMVALLAYTWVGYPCLLWLARQLKARPVARRRDAWAPLISIILPVHNEEEHLQAKIQDCFNLDYTPEKLEILIISDNSTDRTEEIAAELARNDPRIRLLRTSGRTGKSGAQNLAAEYAKGDLLFMTDANTRTPASTLKLSLENFVDPEVGLVTATAYFGEPENAVAEGQGAYWRYELFLRRMESELGILATGSGQLLLMRRELFRPIPVIYGDDCVLPLDVRLQGSRVVQDTRAIVFDTMPHSIAGELRARTRMTARNWTGTLSRPGLLNPFRFPGTAWGLVSHKLLRWLTPFLMGALFLVSTIMALQHRFLAFWFLQTLFYAAALMGWLRTRKGRPAWIFAYPFAFCLANLGFFLGMVKVLRSQRITSYESRSQAAVRSQAIE